MEEINEQMKHDLRYYKSGIRQLYLKSFQKYMIGLVAIMLITVFGIGVNDGLIQLIFILFFVLEIAGALYLLRFLQESLFEAYFQGIQEKLPQTFQKMVEGALQEDHQAYYFLDNQRESVKLKKQNTRNFPSKIPQFTLLVGYNFELEKKSLENPLYFYYYDITKVTHSENYKKDLLKNTNFIAKRRKRRLKTLILTIIGVGLIGSLLYFTGKTYLEKQESQPFVEKDVSDNHE